MRFELLIENFKLERYFGLYEFKTRHLFSSSDCDGYSMQYVLQQASNKELELWNNLRLGYTESEGSFRLREYISKLYQKMTPDNIIVSSPGEANFIFMNILLKSTDHVICISPSYQSLYQVVKTIGCEISFWEPDKNNWHYDPLHLESLVRKNTKLIIINFPHNPTGAFPSINELMKIVEIADDNHIYLFSDEMYHLLTHKNIQEIPCICDVYEKGVSLWGMSKTFGLAGLRIGWLACQNKKLLKKVLSYKDYLSICNNAPSEILSMIAINHKDQFIAPNLLKINKNIRLLVDFKSSHRNFINFISPKAGSTCFAHLNILESTYEFCQKLIKRTGIMLVPSEIFEYESGYVRIGFGRNNFPEILDIFHEYVEKYYN